MKLATLAATACLLSAPAFAQGAPTQADMAACMSSIQDLTAAWVGSKSSGISGQQEIAALKTQVNSKDEAAAKTAAEVSGLKDQIAKLTDQVAELKEQAAKDAKP